MPALKPTQFSAKITWLGVVPTEAELRSDPLTEMVLGFGGMEGEKHAGVTRPSCSRVTSQHPRGTEIANVRQLSVVSAEELAKIAEKIGLDDLDPALVGASLVIEGIPDFSLVPPSSRLQGPDGTTLVIDMQNRPCHLPSRQIEMDHEGHGKAFKTAASGMRGVTAWVERPGTLRLGETLSLHVPDQPIWAHLDAARSA